MPRSPSSLTISWPISASSGRPISTCGVAARRERRSGSAIFHAAGAVGDDQQRRAAALRVVPGVEQRLLVMRLGVVDQAPAVLRTKIRRAGCGRICAGPSRSRHHRPERPAGQMLEAARFGVADEEILLLVGDRPGERQRDLVQAGGPAAFSARSAASRRCLDLRSPRRERRRQARRRRRRRSPAWSRCRRARGWW